MHKSSQATRILEFSLDPSGFCNVRSSPQCPALSMEQRSTFFAPNAHVLQFSENGNTSNEDLEEAGTGLAAWRVGGRP